MRIYLANLAKYNEGILKGKWIELPVHRKELHNEIAAVLGADEEYAIHDYENELFAVNEFDSPYVLNKIAGELEILEHHQLECYRYLREQGYEHEYAMENIEDVFYYEQMNLEQVVDELIEQEYWGHIPDELQWYLDIDKMKRTLEINGYHETDTGVFHYPF